MWGLLLESVEMVGMYPGLESSTFATACQFAAFASWVSVGYATVVFVYRTRLSVLWSPDPEEETHTKWRNPAESIAIDGSVESRARTRGLSPDRPDARTICPLQVDPLVSRLRMKTTRSQTLFEETVT